jgi:hypothetical protein
MPIPWFRSNVGTLQVDFSRPLHAPLAEIVSFGQPGPTLYAGPEGLKVVFCTRAGIDIIRFEHATTTPPKSIRIEWRGGTGKDRASVTVDGLAIPADFDARVLPLSEDQTSLTWGESGDLSAVTLKYWPSRA